MPLVITIDLSDVRTFGTPARGQRVYNRAAVANYLHDIADEIEELRLESNALRAIGVDGEIPRRATGRVIGSWEITDPVR